MNPRSNMNVTKPVKLHKSKVVKNQEIKIHTGESIVVQMPNSPGKRKIALNIKNQG